MMSDVYVKALAPRGAAFIHHTAWEWNRGGGRTNSPVWLWIFAFDFDFNLNLNFYLNFKTVFPGCGRVRIKGFCGHYLFADHIHFHIDLEFAAQHVVGAVGVVALNPDNDGDF